MEKDGVEGEIVLFPLIVFASRWWRACLPDAHEGVNRNIFIGVQEEVRQEINDIGEKDQA